MHEVALMQGVVTTIVDRLREAGGTRITQVHLVLGASGHLTEDAARQHFAILAAGTPAEGAALDIEWLPATYQCLDCRATFTVGHVEESAICPFCGGLALEIAHQDVCYADEIVCDAEPQAEEVS
jgi:hydrogenase nickel incorporation protein HypA/HybF